MSQKCQNFNCPSREGCDNEWSKRTRTTVCPKGMHWMSQIQWIRYTQSKKTNPMPFNQHMEYGLGSE